MGYEEKNSYDEEHDTITLTFEDGSEQECFVWGFVEVDGQSYISLLPMDEVDEEESGCYLYRYDEDADGNPVLGYISDDELLDRVVTAFDQLFEEEEPEYDEVVSEDDL